MASSNEEGQEMVIVEAPDAVGAGGFKVVCFLDETHEVNILWKDDESESGEGGRREDGKTVEA